MLYRIEYLDAFDGKFLNNDKRNEARFQPDKLPNIRINFDSPTNCDVLSTEKGLKLGRRLCPNYLMILDDFTKIESFIDLFHESLARRNSRYAIITTGNNFSPMTFLEENSFFKKVLNLAVILISDVDGDTTEHSTSNLRWKKG